MQRRLIIAREVGLDARLRDALELLDVLRAQRPLGHAWFRGLGLCDRRLGRRWRGRGCILRLGRRDLCRRPPDAARRPLAGLTAKALRVGPAHPAGGMHGALVAQLVQQVRAGQGNPIAVHLARVDHAVHRARHAACAAGTHDVHLVGGRAVRSSSASRTIDPRHCLDLPARRSAAWPAPSRRTTPRAQSDRLPKDVGNARSASSAPPPGISRRNLQPKPRLVNARVCKSNVRRSRYPGPEHPTQPA